MTHLSAPAIPAVDLAALALDAARLFSDQSSEAPLEALTALAGSSLGAAASALYAVDETGHLCLRCGPEQPRLRARAEACLAGRAGERGAERALVVGAGGAPLGVWAVALPGWERGGAWERIVPILSPFFVMGLRQARFQAQINRAQAQAERRIREVATVYEIGQAMDRVEIDRLLDMVTEKATAVMDAQACSLLLRVPDSNSLMIAASYGLPEDVVENARIFVGESIAGRVVETGEPLRLESLSDDPRFQERPIVGNPEVSSSLCMPMKDENGQAMGVLCIRRSKPSPVFSDEDMRLFSIFATQASLAINNAQLYAKLNHKIQELSTLAALTQTITSTLDLDQVLSQIADNIVDVVHFDRCRIYLADMETGRFAPRIMRGFRWDAAQIAGDTFALGEGVIGLSAQRQMPLLVDPSSDTLPALRAYGEALGMESFYAEPIITRGRCIGVVVVSNSAGQRPISRNSLDLLSTFVNQAGIAIENARFTASQERRYAELTTLYEVSRTLAATSGVQKAAQTVNDLATQITDSDAGLLLLLDDTQDALSAVHWRGVSDALGKRLRGFLMPVPVVGSARELRAPRILGADEAEDLLGAEWQPICEAFLARHRATALVPLVVDDAAVGFLLLGKQGADYGDQELKLIGVASSQAATVLRNARSYERRIGQRDLELSAVYDLMQKVRSATTLDDALNSILDIVASLVWSDEAALYTVDEGGQTMTIRAARGEKFSGEVGKGTLPLNGDSLGVRAARARTALIASDPVGQLPGPVGQLPGPGEMCSALAVPLMVGDELIGVLTMESRTPDLYTEESVMMLHLVASQAATIYREMSSLRNLTRYTDNILRSIATGVITVDKHGCIATWNKRAEEIMHMPASQIIGLHYRDFIQRLQVDPVIRDETVQMLELTALTGKVFTRNGLCYRTPQSEETYVNLSASQLRSEGGESLGIVIVFEDVTNEIQMQEEVERVSKLAETGQLAANIAHELRNPLMSIKGAAQLLRSDLPEEFVTQHGEFLDIIVEEVNGLNRITTEFLEFSRVTPPEMTPVSLNALTSRLLQFMGSYLSDHAIRLSLHLDEHLPELVLDKSQIEQIIRNIVINATQAMPRGGDLRVATRLLDAQDVVELEFADTGLGIPADKLEKIWTPFFTTKTKGTGLGLAIARKIVQTHGGRLSVRSAPGQGSTFTMALPLRPLHAHMMPQARHEIADQRSDQAGEIYEDPALYQF